MIDKRIVATPTVAEDAKDEEGEGDDEPGAKVLSKKEKEKLKKEREKVKQIIYHSIPLLITRIKFRGFIL